MLQLPACLLSVFVMYWSLPIGCLLYRIRFLDVFSSERADIFNWSALMMDWFKARVYKVGEHSLHKGNGPVVYLCNHRSWADFFIDKCEFVLLVLHSAALLTICTGQGSGTCIHGVNLQG